MLVLKREHAKWEDSTRAYKVFIDGVKVDDIRDGETKNYPLTEGPHTLQLKIDWCTSKLLNFYVSNGTPVFASCAPTKKTPIIGPLIYITVMYNRYIDLKIMQ